MLNVAFPIVGLIQGTRIKVLDILLPYPNNLIFATGTANCDVDIEFYFDKMVNDLDTPTWKTFSTATTGGTIPRNTKIYFRATALTADGLESGPADTNKFLIAGSTTDTNKFTLELNPVTGATGYNIYAGTKPGMETPFLLNVGALNYITDVSTVIDQFDMIPSAPSIELNCLKRTTQSLPIAYQGGMYIYEKIKVFVTSQGAGTQSGIISLMFMT